MADAEVTRRYPDSISVSVVEKRPFALWQSPAGLRWSNATARVITMARRAEIPAICPYWSASAPKAGDELVEAIAHHRAVAARMRVMQRVCQRRWNLILDDGVVVKLPETGWHKQLDALEHLIVEKGMLERNIEEIDLRSRGQLFLRAARAGRTAAGHAGERGIMGETVRMRTGNAQPTAYRTGLVAALDIGSSKITCLIGRAEPGSLKVLGAPCANRRASNRARSPAWSRPRKRSATPSPRPRTMPTPASRMC